jgi:tRNA(Met) C34 N-acetyltransferase TmcA
MPPTDRMLTGAIAANPGRYDGAGEYRYCRACDTIFFTSAKQPDSKHTDHPVVALPALNQDGSERLSRAFKVFLQRWPEVRRDEIERFAQRKGWELAMEHADGGGALTDNEVAQWRQVIEAELKRLVSESRALIGG